VTGVWVGNADNRRCAVSGVEGGAYLARFMEGKMSRQDRDPSLWTLTFVTHRPSPPGA
jgi:hypothetical protein